MSDKINDDKIAAHWIEMSDKDYKTMLNMFKSKDYHWALFIGHLVIERLLKACVMKNKKQHAPPTHDLLRLAGLAGLKTEEEKSDWLDTITTFNINARYDNYKKEFYKKCTPEYTTAWIAKIKILRKWIKETQLK